jgi:phospholipase C
VPYALNVQASADGAARQLTLQLSNSGRSAAVFQVRSGDGQSGPWTYTVGPHADLSDSWPYAQHGAVAFDLSVYGPNGFMRAFKSGAAKNSANLEVQSTYAADRSITLVIHNRGSADASVSFWDDYAAKRTTRALKPNQAWAQHVALDASFGWYDFTLEVDGDSSFMQRLAGHVETGRDSMSDPALGS